MEKVSFDTQLIKKASTSSCNWLTDTVVKEVNGDLIVEGL